MATIQRRSSDPFSLVAAFIRWLIVVLFAVIWMIPFIFMVFTSLKTQPEILTTPAFEPPPTIAWENYPDAFDRGDLWNSTTNTLIISVVKVPIGLFVASLAAFALSRLRVPYRKWVLGFFVLGMMVPIQVTLAPLFHVIISLGLLNTKLGVILPYIAFGNPYQIFMLYGFFSAIPKEIDESARIDGATNFQLYWRIIMPLAKPALAALFVIDFVATWNEFSIALVLLQDQSSWTLPLALQNFNTQFVSLYGPLNAAIVITTVPVMIVYLMFQRYFVKGIFAGAIKG